LLMDVVGAGDGGQDVGELGGIDHLKDERKYKSRSLRDDKQKATARTTANANTEILARHG
jgi:hypothetical protein